jgi:hypothetical protein
VSDKKLKETVYGKHHKYEIYEERSTFGSPKYYVYRDGRPHRGSFSSFADAVEAAKKEG